MFNKQNKEILELDKKITIKELSAELKDREEVSKRADKALKEYYTYEAQRASEENYKVTTDGLDKSDRKEGLLKRLKNIEDKSNNQLLAKYQDLQ